MELKRHKKNENDQWRLLLLTLTLDKDLLRLIGSEYFLRDAPYEVDAESVIPKGPKFERRDAAVTLDQGPIPTDVKSSRAKTSAQGFLASSENYSVHSKQ